MSQLAHSWQQHQWGTAPEFVGPRHELRERLLLNLLLRAQPGSQVLNVGAGQGSFSLLLEERGFQVTSTDLAEAALEVLRRAVSGPVCRADATELPFEPQSFDSVVLGEVLEHVEDDSAALHEVRRVVRPGGVVALSVPANPDWYGPSDDWAGHYRRYTRDTLVERCEQAGLTVERCTAWGFPCSSLYHRKLYEPRLTRRGAETAGSAPKFAVRLLRLALQLDRLFVGVSYGALGYLLVARSSPAAVAS